MDNQTLAWIIGQLHPVGAVCKSFDYAVGSCLWVMQFLGVVTGQDCGVQTHMITNLVKLSMHSLVVQLLLQLLFCTSGLLHPVISSFQSLLSSAYSDEDMLGALSVLNTRSMHRQLSLFSKHQKKWSVPSHGMYAGVVC